MKKIDCRRCQTSAGCAAHRKFCCRICKRVVSWEEATDGCMPNACAGCWCRVHRNGKQHVKRHGAQCDVPKACDEAA